MGRKLQGSGLTALPRLPDVTAIAFLCEESDTRERRDTMSADPTTATAAHVAKKVKALTILASRTSPRSNRVLILTYDLSISLVRNDSSTQYACLPLR